jgi:hypothetical protein
MSIQTSIEMACGRETFGIHVPKALRVLDIQAEDDEGDLIEMAKIVDQRIGWSHYEQYWAHSREPGVLLWVPADSDQIALASEAAKAKPDDLLTLIPKLDPITQAQFYVAAKEKKNVGINKARNFAKVLLAEGKIYAWKIPREKPLKAEIGYAQQPQPSEDNE